MFTLLGVTRHVFWKVNEKNAGFYLNFMKGTQLELDKNLPNFLQNWLGRAVDTR